MRGIRAGLGLAMVSAMLLAPAMGALAQDSTPAADHSDIEIDYILHGLNAFTERIKTGAEDAADDYGVTVAVFGDASFDTPTHQAFFESSLQRGVDGIAVVPNPGDLWITPLQQATDAGIPMVGANITAMDSTLGTWVGQNEFNSGVILGQQLLAQLTAAGISEGTIPVGICIPAATVLQERDQGLRLAFEGTNFNLLEAQEVLAPVPDNYSRWENILAANPDAVAAVGLCSIDIPNLAQLKERNGSSFLIGGYDLDPPTLQAIKDGTAQVTVGQQEYLQGYLPIALLAESLINGTPLVEGWFETPTEVVTAENVDAYVSRQTDDAVQREYYKQYIADTYGDLSEPTRPYEDLNHTTEATAATPAP